MANAMHTNTAQTEIDALIEEALTHREGDFAAGLSLAEKAAQAAECGPQSYCRQSHGRALAALGLFLLRLKREPEAETCLRRGLALSREAGDRTTEGGCLYSLGEERAVADQYTAALEFLFAAEQVFETLADRSRQAEALNDIGSVYNIMDDYSQAIHFHLRAFRLRETLEDKKKVAESLNNIGNAYGRSEDFVHSVQYHEQCLAASRENTQIRLEALCLSNLSMGYSGLGRLPEAVAAGKAALVLAQQQGNPEKQCYALLSIGRACEKGTEYEEAVSWYSEAAALATESGSRRNECEAQSALGSALLLAGRVTEAHCAFLQTEKIAGDLNLSQFQAQAQAGLSKVCEQTGNHAAALAHHKECYTLEKALSSAAADKRSKTLMMQMEVEKVQKEAQIHRLKNVELAALNSALEEANQTLQTQAVELQAQAELLEAQGEELRAQADELQRQATEDGLTGLANRRHLESWLAGRFHEAQRTGRPLTVAMADVDRFKQINDRFGHQIGDEVLMSVGLLLRHACRASDLAARYGGEEFVLVLPETDASAARTVCERFRQAVEKHPWQTIHPGLSVTVSLGFSEGPSETAAPSYERLLGQADAHLYLAKNAGRNRVYPACATGSLA